MPRWLDSVPERASTASRAVILSGIVQSNDRTVKALPWGTDQISDFHCESSRIASQPAARRARNSPRVFRCHALDPKLDAALNKVLEAAVEREPLFRDLKRVPHEKIASEVNPRTSVWEWLKFSPPHSTTLGRLSFNQFAPKDLKVNLASDAAHASTSLLEQIKDSLFSSNSLPLTLPHLPVNPPQVNLASDAAQALTGLPEQLKGEWEGAPNKYIVHSHFSFEDTSGETTLGFTTAIAEFEYPGPGDASETTLGFTTAIAEFEYPGPGDAWETILGFTTAIAEFEYPGPKDSTERLPIKFTGYRIAPADPDNQLQQWLAMLKAGNSMMIGDGTYLESTKIMVHFHPAWNTEPIAGSWATLDDNGVAAVAFDPAMPAHLDYVMMSEQYQVSRGNLGSVVITKRVG
eukprot:gene17988-24401_t